MLTKLYEICLNPYPERMWAFGAVCVWGDGGAGAGWGWGGLGGTSVGPQTPGAHNALVLLSHDLKGKSRLF